MTDPVCELQNESLVEQDHWARNKKINHCYTGLHVALHNDKYSWLVHVSAQCTALYHEEL